MNEIIEHKEQNQIAISTPTTANFLTIISQMASNPNVDISKMSAILDIQERMMNKQAEIEFNAAFLELGRDMPRITKNAEIKHSGKVIAKYATFEQIDSYVRPILLKHGFSPVSFDTAQTEKGVIFTATLAHKGGHKKSASTMPLVLDTSGSKNNVQAAGSTQTYGMRQAIVMLLSLVFEGEDDDGQKSGFTPISDEQAVILKDLIRETGTDVKRFLGTMVSGVASIDEVGLADFNRLHNALLAKRNKAGA